MIEEGHQTPLPGPQSGVYIYCRGELVRVSGHYRQGGWAFCTRCRAKVRIAW